MTQLISPVNACYSSCSLVCFAFAVAAALLNLGASFGNLWEIAASHRYVVDSLMLDFLEGVIWFAIIAVITDIPQTVRSGYLYRTYIPFSFIPGFHRKFPGW